MYTTFLLIPLFMAQGQPWNFDAQDRLPPWANEALNWAQYELRLNQMDVALKKESNWRVLDETEITYLGEGKTRRRRRTIQIVLKEAGAHRASYYRIDGDKDTTKIEHLLGWHLTRKGLLRHLKKDNQVIVSSLSEDYIDNSEGNIGFFERVTKGSVIVFESQEVVSDMMASVSMVHLLGSVPIMKRVIKFHAQDPSISIDIIPQNLNEWNLSVKKDKAEWTVQNLPPLKWMPLEPTHFGYSPMVYIHFKDPKFMYLNTWDDYAKWYFKQFQEKSLDQLHIEKHTLSKESLKTCAEEVRDHVSYKQVYLSKNRGWIPAPGMEVFRNAYGDCKDMVSCLAYRLAEQGVEVFPVMANIYDGRNTGPSSPAGPSFNHLIGAIAIEQPLGLASEVTVKGKHYILFDPTSRFTNLGFLPRAHEGRQVMICTDTGATWVDIPARSIEKSGIQFEVKGSIDSDFTFTGTFTINESGDAYGFRRILSLDGTTKERIDSHAARVLKLPPATTCKVVSFAVEEGKADISFHVQWPDFLWPDSQGYRLPKSIIGPPMSAVSKKTGRKTPVELPTIPKQNWTIILKGCNLVPLKSSFSESKGTFQILWQVEQGKTQKESLGESLGEPQGDSQVMTFSIEGDSKEFDGKEIPNGLAIWNGFVSIQHNFWNEACLFIKP